MHTTEQLNTALAGRYTIERRIGEGGMATVYLARDVRHNRRVALKVLKPDLGAIVGAERFLSEIEVTANLQHPNLLPLFDSGASDGILFYVMPFVEGETLRTRLDREMQLPVDEAVRIATAVAGALDYAHRHGVIHRDLKPENILLHEGQPLVADFGIALALSNAGGNRITQTGLSLGTPQYMSPEQATGDRTIDARADIYSLGAVTYEMLAGEPPHTGASAQAIIARVITERPRSIRIARPNVPAQVEAAVECALEKLAADRFATAREFADALSGARPLTLAGRAPEHGAPPSRARRHRALMAAPWVLAAAAAGVAIWALTRPAAVAPPPVRFTLDVPDTLNLLGVGGPNITMSRDGTQLAYAGRTLNGEQRLYLRRLNDPVAQVVPGTENASVHSFSPDGDALLFSTSATANDAGGALRIVATIGGASRSIATGLGGGAGWGERGIVYAMRESLMVVSPDGGSRRLIIRGDSTRRIFRFPVVLPGGTHALVTYWRRAAQLDSARMGVVSLEDGTFEDLGIPGVHPQYAAPGFLLFGRQGGEIYVAPFSLAKRRVTGVPTLFAQDVWMGAGGGTGVAASQAGTIAFRTLSARPDADRALMAVSRTGAEEQLTRERMEYASPRVSPDGRRIVVSVGERAGPNSVSSVWIHDIDARTTTIFSADSGSSRAEWTRDGTRVLYRQGEEGVAIWSRPWNRSSPAELVARGPLYHFNEVSLGPAGGLAVIRRGTAGPRIEINTELLLAPTDSLANARPLFTKIASMVSPAVSPDGRLLAFVSNESRRLEVYVTPIPGPGPRVQVSTDGAVEPVWSRDGKSLFYRTGQDQARQKMVSAAILQQPMLAVGRRDTLFADPYVRFRSHATYDVFPDGRFLMVRSLGEAAAERARIIVVVNWLQAMAKPRP